ncbi:Hypothetical predicted protein [Octopus vulgaris]|uniref:Uncharacterized protein n=1 Tax=Octopus vulgaris TaxID=6645 RepID=A0AA36FHE7_OCTVU|nr:Hypothetical predicted protein [Octopus vulgaris]
MARNISTGEKKRETNHGFQMFLISNGNLSPSDLFFFSDSLAHGEALHIHRPDPEFSRKRLRADSSLREYTEAADLTVTSWETGGNSSMYHLATRYHQDNCSNGNCSSARRSSYTRSLLNITSSINSSCNSSSRSNSSKSSHEILNGARNSFRKICLAGDKLASRFLDAHKYTLSSYIPPCCKPYRNH